VSASLWRIEDGKLRLSFHEGQAAAWQSERRFVAMIAGTQGGKTSFGPWWLHREINRCGPGDYLAVTSSFDLFKLKALPQVREVFEHLLRRGRYWSGDRVMELADPQGRFWANKADDPMWGRIILRSASAGSGLESATARACWADEAGQDEFTVETWEAVLRRLALAEGRVLITTTPYSLGWLKTELYDRWTAGDPTIEVIQFESIQNPAFPRAEFERAKATMPSWRFAMFYQALFSRPAGLIYTDFDPTFHVIEPFEIPPAWPRYFGSDFGGANTALLWLAHQPGADRYIVFSESLSGGLSTREHARAAKTKAEGTKLMGGWGGAASEDQARTDWGMEGFPIRKPPVADVEAGISRVIQLIKENRLFVFRTCRGLLDELETYRRKLDASGQPTEEIEAKRMFHRLDALRYVASGLVGVMQPRLYVSAGEARPAYGGTGRSAIEEVARNTRLGLPNVRGWR
jgi:hypothetical protein